MGVSVEMCVCVCEKTAKLSLHAAQQTAGTHRPGHHAKQQVCLSSVCFAGGRWGGMALGRLGGGGRGMTLGRLGVWELNRGGCVCRREEGVSV